MFNRKRIIVHQQETIAALREQIEEERRLNDQEMARREADHIREINDLRLQIQVLKNNQK